MKQVTTLLFAITLFIPSTALSQDPVFTKFENQLEKAILFVNANQLDSASFYVNEVFESIDETKYAGFYIKASLIRVTILFKSGRINEAEELRQATQPKIDSAFTRPNNFFGWTAMLNGEMLYYLSDLKAAYSSFELALKEYAPLETSTISQMQGRINNYMGIISLRTRDFDLAADHLNRSIERYSQVEGTEAFIAGVQSNLSTIYMQQAKYHQAIEGFLNAVELRRKTRGDNDRGLIAPYTNLSIIYAEMRRYNLALEYQQKAFRISEKFESPDPESIQQRHTAIAKLLAEMKQDSLSMYHLNLAQEAVDSFNGSLPRAQANIDLQLGYLLNTRNETLKSIDRYESAAKNFMKAYGQIEMNQIDIMKSIGHGYMMLGNYHMAREKLEESVEVIHELIGTEHLKLSEVHLLLAHAYISEQKYKEALKESQLSIVAHPGYTQVNEMNFDNVQNKNLLLLSFQTQANILRDIYSNSQQEKDANQSLRYYNLSDALVNELNENEVYEDRLVTLDTLDQVYDNAVELEYDLYTSSGLKTHVESAFYYADKGRNALLKQQLNQSDQKKYGSIPTEMLSKEKSLKEDIAYLKSASYLMTEADIKETIDSVKLDYYNDRLFTSNRSLDSLKSQFKAQFPSYFNSQYNQKKINLRDIQKSLSTDDQIIQFLTTNDFIYTFSITSEDFDLTRIKKENHLIKQLHGYLSMINNPTSDIQEISKLAKWLFSELLEPLGDLKEYITIVPDGELNLLPFETLPIPNNNTNAEPAFLIEKYNISYASSSSHLFRNVRTEPSKKIELMAMASSYTSENNSLVKDTIRAGLGPLKYTIDEAAGLIDLYGGDLYLEERATETNFKKNAKSSRIIHIASHGIVDHQQPLFSRLVLEKDPSDSVNDGNLFVHELYNMSLDAQMVVLSACNTASGQMARGEGLLNIGRGFFYAGVPSVVMSHWQVDDQSTSILMKYFYEALSKGLKKSEALRSAKLKFISEASPNKKHPFYWGAFISMGDDSPIIKKGIRTSEIVIVAGVLLLILVGGQQFRKRKMAI